MSRKKQGGLGESISPAVSCPAPPPHPLTILGWACSLVPKSRQVGLPLRHLCDFDWTQANKTKLLQKFDLIVFWTHQPEFVWIKITTESKSIKDGPFVTSKSEDRFQCFWLFTLPNAGRVDAGIVGGTYCYSPRDLWQHLTGDRIAIFYPPDIRLSHTNAATIRPRL